MVEAFSITMVLFTKDTGSNRDVNIFFKKINIATNSEELVVEK